MLRSLYSGISGLRAEQVALDVTGNNIANVNTIGFKSSSTQFETALSQTVQTSGLATATKGGTNPVQVGLGVRVAGVAINTTQGSQQTTGNQTDAMISGDGYFVVKTGSQQLYTRDGAFHFDSQGRLSTADGSLLQGWTAANGTVSTGVRPATVSISHDVAPAKSTENASLTGNLPSDAITGDSFTRDISTYNGSGVAETLSITFTKQAGTGVWNYSASVKDPSVTTQPAATTGTITVNASSNSMGSTTPPSMVTVAGSGTQSIKVDMTALTGYAGISTAAVATQDGKAAGSLLSYTIGQDGVITGSFSNGATEVLAKIALARFNNPGGLSQSGNSTWTESSASGTPTLNTAGEDGFGSIVSGALEMSNVDLSQEFTNLIVAQRGFQAAARIITTSDEVLQELTQLKR